MLFPIKLRLAHYEAEAIRKYLHRMVELSFAPTARNEVIVLAEYFQKFDSSVRAKVFKIGINRLGLYNLPLSVARILWLRWQVESNNDIIQGILGKIDYELNAKNRIPKFPKTII